MSMTTVKVLSVFTIEPFNTSVLDEEHAVNES
jgi:hypothetical protein